MEEAKVPGLYHDNDEEEVTNRLAVCVWSSNYTSATVTAEVAWRNKWWGGHCGGGGKQEMREGMTNAIVLNLTSPLWSTPFENTGHASIISLTR